MKTESCREWRESLGAYVLGQLPDSEHAGLEAHLEGCADCRAELEGLKPLARVMPLADPDCFTEPVLPPPALGESIAATIASEQRSAKRGRRLRFGLAFGGVAAAASAALLAVFVLASGSDVGSGRRVSFSSLPQGVEITANLEPRVYGTELEMYVDGVPSGTLCRVFLRGPQGGRLPAGTFRYRAGEDEAVLSSALDLSRTRAVVIYVGRRAFTAPVAPRKGA